MSVSIKGYNTDAVTLIAADGLQKGNLVKISENLTAAPCAAGNIPCGVCLGTDGKYASIQLKGYAKAAYSGTAPALGMTIVTADGADKIKTAATGRSVMVVSVDTASATAEIIF